MYTIPKPPRGVSKCPPQRVCPPPVVCPPQNDSYIALLELSYIKMYNDYQLTTFVGGTVEFKFMTNIKQENISYKIEVTDLDSGRIMLRPISTIGIENLGDNDINMIFAPLKISGRYGSQLQSSELLYSDKIKARIVTMLDNGMMIYSNYLYPKNFQLLLQQPNINIDS